MRIRIKSVLAAVAAASLGSVAAAQVFPASGLPLAINDSPTVTSTLTVAGGPAGVTQLELVLRLNHTYLSDLDILLVRGTRYLHLTSDNGGPADNFGNVRFRDAAYNSISGIGVPPSNLTGDFRPEGGTISLNSGASFSLAGLTRTANFAEFISGETADGAWTLVIDDDATNDFGSLLYWSLEFNGAADATGPTNTPPPPPFSGDFTSTPNVLTFGVTATGTTRWNGPVGAQPGLTDGAGENPLTPYAAANPSDNYPGAEVAYRFAHSGGPIAFKVSGTGTDAALVIIDATGTPAGAIAVADSAFGANDEIASFAALAAGTYYVVVDVASATSAGTAFALDTGTPALNDACASATPLTAGTSTAFDSSFSTSDGFNTDFCNGTAASPDIWFSFTSAADGVATFESCDAFADATLSIHTSCLAFVPLRCSSSGCGTDPFLPSISACVSTGVPIYVRVAGFSDVTGAGTLTTSFQPGAQTYSPPAGTAEPEPCRTEVDDTDTVNGGCDTGSALYTPIASGQTIIGTISNYIGSSVTDLDQYTFTLAANADVMISGQAEFDAVIGLLSDALDCNNVSPLGDSVRTTAPCRPGFSFTRSLTAGTYAIALAPSDSDNFCEDPGNGYWVRLTVGAPCPADFNNSGSVTVQDIFDFLAAYFLNDPSADFNGVGGVTVQDIFDFLAAYFLGCL